MEGNWVLFKGLYFAADELLMAHDEVFDDASLYLVTLCRPEILVFMIEEGQAKEEVAV